MHEGESLYVFNWHDAMLIGIFLAAWIFLRLKDKAPSVNEIRDFANIWNSRGGNIVILVGLTVYSLRIAIRLIYHLIELSSSGKLDPTNAIVAVAIAYVTGQVSGAFMGALLKTMTGNEGGTSVPPETAPSTTISTSTVTSSSGTGDPAKILVPTDAPAKVQIVGAVKTESGADPKP